MPTAEHCIAMAEDAERLACLVSYGRDKARLREQAQVWRARASELSTPIAAAPAEPATRLMDWLRRRA